MIFWHTANIWSPRRALGQASVTFGGDRPMGDSETRASELHFAFEQ